MEEDFVAAFQNLRHTHDMLLKDKQTLESCFEQEAQEHDRLAQELKTQSDGLRAAIRNIRLQNRESAEALASLGPQFERFGCAEITPSTSLILCECPSHVLSAF